MDPTMNKLVGFGVGFAALAVVVLMSVAITDGFGYNLRDDTSASYNGITVTTNGSLTNFGATYPFVQDVTGCVNATDATDALNAANYTVVEGTGANGGFVLLDAGADFVGETVNCTVEYKADTNASDSAAVFLAAIAIIGSFAAVIILAMMGKIIYKMFNDN